MSGHVRVVRDDWDYIVYVSDDETGSSTSLSAYSVEDGYEQALAWLGYSIQLEAH